MKLTYGEIKELFADNNLDQDDGQNVLGFNRDSRLIQTGEVYVAIRGEHHDGHNFVEQAFEKGAAAAIVDLAFKERKNTIRVPDTIEALGKLAAYYRDKFNQPVIAITGSSGKTTTKEMLAHVLSQHGKVIATKGNLNNHIGVPVTIFEFDDEAHYFVVELGMNHLEEIRYLAKMVRPNMALITSIGEAHLEGVGGTIEGVAKAKGELFEELTEDETAFVFQDDEYINKLETRAKKITYGFTSASQYWVSDIHMNEIGSNFVIHNGPKTFHVTLNVLGRHQIQNALAVFAVASELELNPASIVKDLENFMSKTSRGQSMQMAGLTILDDTYNANPHSMKAAIQSLSECYPDKYKVAVLGGMLELGNQSVLLHEKVGEYCKSIGIDELFVYGDHAKHYLQGFGYMEPESQKRNFLNHENLAEALKSLAKRQKNAVVLIKGSRGMAMEKVLEHLKD